MGENIELTAEQKEVKDFIKVYVKIMLYIPLVWISCLVIFLIVKGFVGGFN